MNNRTEIIKKLVVAFLAVSFLNINISIAAPAMEKSSSKSSVPKKVSPAYLPSYLLGPGDMLEISVWKEEGLQKQVLVRPDGGITFPLAGELRAGGKTALKLQQSIVNKIKQYIPDPVVTVSVIKVASNNIYVIGKVNRVSNFEAASYINVMQALALAGGLNPFAKASEIKILRKVKGKDIAIPFDYSVVSQGKDLKLNIILKNGDVVVVP